MIPSLKLNRLVVMKDGHRVYDQNFHDGLNIIRGNNGSGKSTIMDFIFYVLGGDLKDWKAYALLCDEVIAEIDASGSTLTLKREISKQILRPMRIYFGAFDNAMSSGSDGWSLLPYVRSDDARRSFSQVLFETLKLPEIPGDGGSNITMHQILRLMYVDQSTPFQRIFRVEQINNDSKVTRNAVAELLCGIGGYDLYSKRLQARQLEKDLSEARTKYTNLLKAASALEENLHTGSIASEVANLNEKQEALYKEIEHIEANEVDQSETVKQANKERRELYSESSKIRDEIVGLERKQKSLDYEIQDSESFIQHLSNMLLEYESASQTFLELGSIHFEKCPACFSSLPEFKEGHCGLCGQELSDKEKESRALAIKLDIEGQLNESQRIQRSREEELDNISRRLKGLRLSYSNLAKRYNELTRTPVDGRSALVSERSKEIGRIEARLQELEKLKNISEELTELSEKKDKLSNDLTKLEEEIDALEASVERRKKTVLTNIADNTKYFLRLDMPEHNDFDELEKFTFDFEDDWFAVNGEPNISTSASGMVVVKNSLFMAILKSALEDQKMLFPRFLLLDNVEDKGMVGDRVRHFQKIMVDWSNAENNQHQIIITTSTINPELDIEDYVIGPSYTEENRTLNIGKTAFD